ERRGPQAQREARSAGRPAGEAPLGERRPRVAPLLGGVEPADPGARARAARSRARRPVAHDVRRPRAQVKGLPNRRLRLLLLVFLLVFSGAFLRAAWLQGVKASSLAGLADRQHQETIVIPAGRGSILDRAGVQLAIGEQGTTVYANPKQVR